MCTRGLSLTVVSFLLDSPRFTLPLAGRGTPPSPMLAGPLLPTVEIHHYCGSCCVMEAPARDPSPLLRAGAARLYPDSRDVDQRSKLFIPFRTGKVEPVLK